MLAALIRVDYHGAEDCLYKANWGMEEHIALLKEMGLPIPKTNPNPLW